MFACGRAIFSVSRWKKILLLYIIGNTYTFSETLPQITIEAIKLWQKVIKEFLFGFSPAQNGNGEAVKNKRQSVRLYRIYLLMRLARISYTHSRLMKEEMRKRAWKFLIRKLQCGGYRTHLSVQKRFRLSLRHFFGLARGK